MHAKSPQHQDRIPIVQERKDGNNGLFEILNILEKQIHRSPNVMDISRVEGESLLELPVHSLEVKIVSLHAVNIFPLRFGEIYHSIALIRFRLVLFPNSLELSGNVLEVYQRCSHPFSCLKRP
jgi:hypothetical protein